MTILLADFVPFPLLSEFLPIATAIIGSIVGYEYRRYREQQRKNHEEIEVWYDDCQDAISRGRHEVRRAQLRGDIDYSVVLNSIDELSQRLAVKKDNHPSGVRKEAVEAVEGVSIVYAKATALANVNSEKEGMELLAELFEMGQQEYNSDLDFSEVLLEAGKSSTHLDYMLQQSQQHGISEEEIAETVEEMFLEWDSEEFMQLSNAMESGQDLDEMVDFAMRVFFELAETVSEDSYEILDQSRPKR